MTDDKKNLGHLIAVDMPNGYTYIGREEINSSSSLVLKEILLLRTENLIYSNTNYIELANETYSKQEKKNLEKQIRIDHPGAIHYLEQ